MEWGIVQVGNCPGFQSDSPNRNAALAIQLYRGQGVVQNDADLEANRKHWLKVLFFVVGFLDYQRKPNQYQPWGITIVSRKTSVPLSTEFSLVERSQFID